LFNTSLKESEWLLFNVNWAIFSYKMYMIREQVTYWWDDNVCFVLDQHIELEFYIGSSLKQHWQGMLLYFGTHVHLFWFWANQSLFLLLRSLRETKNTNFIVLVRPHQGSNTQYTTLDASMLPIRRQMLLICI
jgi:hypothetical protein